MKPGDPQTLEERLKRAGWICMNYDPKGPDCGLRFDTREQRRAHKLETGHKGAEEIGWEAEQIKRKREAAR